MKRVVSVWLPAWPIERLRRAEPNVVPDDRPFALVAAGTHGVIITAVNRRAAAEGVRTGQSLADARAALPGLLTRLAEPAQDRAALLALARWSGRYGPSRNVEGDDGLWIDVTGVAHLFADRAQRGANHSAEARLLADLVRRLGTFGLTARAALADTPGAAFALARFAPHKEGRTVISPAGAMRAALAGLPVEGLRLEAETLILLKRLGLRRIGQLYDLPRAALARRFRALKGARKATAGSSAMADTVLTRLDQALGRLPEPQRPLAERPVHLVRRIFSEPLVSAAGVETAVAELATALCALLDDAAEGARRLRLCLYRADGTMAEAQAGTSEPCREPRHILKLLAEKLSSLDAGFGIDVLTLEATGVEPLATVQPALAARLEEGARSDSAPLIDRLANRLGPERVFRIALCESHIPERAEQRIPALARLPARSLPLPAPWPPRLALRPPFLFPAPEPIAVVAEVPEGPPVRFTWRRVSHRVAKAAGPERLAPEWWRALARASGADEETAAPRPRDYYCLEDDRGGRYWVFRDGLYSREAEERAPVWYMHGLFG
jgi:protein ImuB